MSAQKTKFPKKVVPARKIHGGTTIVGKNGLPVDALATLEPGTSIVRSDTALVSYSTPTVTVAGSVDLTPVLQYGVQSFKHTGILIFTDFKGASYIIDTNSIDNSSKTFDIYTDETFTSSPVSIDLRGGWICSEGELVNRLQTTSSAVIDSVEFRDIDIKFQLDGDPVRIVDKDGDELDILPDGSIPFSQNPITTPTINNIAIPTANVEQSFAIPDGTRRLRIQARGNAKLQISFTSGQTGTNYITIYPGNSYEESEIFTTSKTLYFRSNKSGDVLEILSWS